MQEVDGSTYKKKSAREDSSLTPGEEEDEGDVCLVCDSPTTGTSTPDITSTVTTPNNTEAGGLTACSMDSVITVVSKVWLHHCHYWCFVSFSFVIFLLIGLDG